MLAIEKEDASLLPCSVEIHTDVVFLVSVSGLSRFGFGLFPFKSQETQHFLSTEEETCSWNSFQRWISLQTPSLCPGRVVQQKGVSTSDSVVHFKPFLMLNSQSLVSDSVTFLLSTCGLKTEGWVATSHGIVCARRSTAAVLNSRRNADGVPQQFHMQKRESTKPTQIARSLA